MKIKSIKYILLLLLLFIFKDFWGLPYFNLVLTYKKVLMLFIVFLGIFILYDIKSLFINNELIRKYKKYILIILLFILFTILSKLPYINIILSPWEVFLITWIIGMYLLKTKSGISYLSALLFVLGALTLMLIGEMDTAEQIGNLVYVLLVVGFIQDAYSNLRVFKKSAKN